MVKNQVKGKVTRCGTLYLKKVNKQDFYDQSSKDVPDFLFGKLWVRYK